MFPNHQRFPSSSPSDNSFPSQPQQSSGVLYEQNDSLSISASGMVVVMANQPQDQHQHHKNSYFGQGKQSFSHHGHMDGLSDDESSANPPATYIAHAIAEHLLPMGPELYNRKSDANCILSVGPLRFYVHVQMLAARSPTFRHIFDQMISEGVWKSSATASMATSDCESLSMHSGDDNDNDNDSDDHSEGGNGEAFQGGQDHLRSGHAVYRHDGEDDDTSMGEEDLEDDDAPRCATSAAEEVMDQTSTTSEDNANDDWARKTPELEESDSEDALPILEISMDEPETSRFDELLYWIYTGDSNRWLISFNPQNYISILKNIYTLNIHTEEVFDICKAFEERTSPDQGLRGEAEKLLLPLIPSGLPMSFSEEESGTEAETEDHD